MDLKEAKEITKLAIYNAEEHFRLYDEAFVDGEDIEAIKAVLSALDNSVSKDEIKAKINDINNWLDSGRYMHYSMDPYELEAQKRILQELLNKGE